MKPSAAGVATIFRGSLQAISDEMFAAMRKTAMSPIIYEVLDMGTGITAPPVSSPPAAQVFPASWVSLTGP